MEILVRPSPLPLPGYEARGEVEMAGTKEVANLMVRVKNIWEG
jgi:hypothetical protein